MHAYLLTGTNSKNVNAKAKSLAKKEGASLMEFEIKKISDVRELSRFTNLKIEDKTAIYIKGIDQATTEALNAFLKNLEEPQEDLFYILTATSEHKLLPTIVSRCQVIRIGERDLDEKTFKKTKKFLELGKAEKLNYIKKLRKREDAESFLEDLIFNTHNLLKEGKGNQKNLANILKEAETTKRRVAAYGNPSLQLTNFVLQVE